MAEPESLLERAIAIALEAHSGQVDKAGAPYILHVLRVMLAVEGDLVRTAAVLHDVVEDSDWTFAELRAEGFPEDVVEGIDAVTRREGESYEAFVRRAGRHPVGRAVKVADLRDNADLGRIPNPTPKDRARLDRYRAALSILGEETNPEETTP